ncbi:hypothetical protein KBI31_02350 [Patescibacteria group bacterium]|jgi:hypothetical protein|nr:hypothetical protein [Patescibacteria group bacterium]HPD07979.1 hypothetical protein [bacterium]HRT11322.1 hypothetical protein [Patescibacteria group bacterium]HRU90088.1 hypothetical protein [Patescibacteria group bacterium]
MEKIIRSKKRNQLFTSKTLWLILGIIINTVGLFLVVRWYGQFTSNQRPFVNVDESVFKVFANSISEKQPLSPEQRRLLKTSLTQQSVEEFLSLSLLNNPKFQNLRLNYIPPEVTPTSSTTTVPEEDLTGLKIGNPHPFGY